MEEEAQLREAAWHALREAVEEFAETVRDKLTWSHTVSDTTRIRAIFRCALC
jgi:hypothetical protein